MTQKNNIYDLVDKVNENKNKSSFQKEKEMNDIFSMLDEIKDDNNISVEEVREKVNNYQNSKKAINDSLQNYSGTVNKPNIPTSVLNYDKYSECLFAFIQAVDYGSNNSREYVNGHKAALEKYYTEFSNNKKDIYVVEAHVNNEIDKFTSKDSLYDKGYYDGLFYIHRSIKKAKELMSNELYNKLKEKIK